MQRKTAVKWDIFSSFWGEIRYIGVGDTVKS